ncbi:DUF647 family protein [Obelidium mucronatum]|nr:DUF647 family protein [Obelidium mucronatum]
MPYIVTHPSKQRASSRFLKDAFLPVGYPDSVSPDYTAYQIFDSLQAFCSNITGVLATRASFKRAGVGDSTASLATATMTWILQDGTGMIGRIIYAWKVSFFLDADAKQWRFYADILNDSASFINLGTPYLLSKKWFTISACLSGLLRALCGVTGGATKAALSQHFAIRDNMADLHAKEGSQETVVGLVGMLLGAGITHFVKDGDDSRGMTWLCFVVFTFLHLLCNYNGIAAIVMPSLNTQRAFLVIREYLLSASENDNEKPIILSPSQVARLETIFWPRNYYNSGLWRNDKTNRTIFNATSIRMGVSLDRVVEAWSDGVGDQGGDWDSLSSLFPVSPRHILAYDKNHKRILVAIHAEATPQDIFLAYFHALILQKAMLSVGSLLKDGGVVVARRIVAESAREFERHKSVLLVGLAREKWEIESAQQSRILLHEEYRFL